MAGVRGVVATAHGSRRTVSCASRSTGTRCSSRTRRSEYSAPTVSRRSSAPEQAAAREPLPGGPFRGFLGALHRLQAEFGPERASPIRTALVTARSAPAHERVVRTLRTWGIRIDEALFLGGLEKREFLQAFGADIFFDDQRCHCNAARGVAAIGHVPSGIANEGS